MKLASLTFLMLCPLSALADIAQCDRPTMAHHAGEYDNRDLGTGVVSHTNFVSIVHDGVGGSSKWLNVISCGSGHTIRIGLSSSSMETDPATGETSRVTRFSVDEEVMARFDEMVLSDVSYTFEALETEMSRLSPVVEVNIQTEEQPCGCAAAYPRHGSYEAPFDLSMLQ